MGIRFACHSCQHALHVKDFLGGKRGKCPDCGISFQIPNSDAPTSIPVSAVDAPESSAQAQAAAPAPIPPTQETVAWYLRIEDGQQFGPVDEVTFQTWFSEGRVTETSHVWRDGWPEWQTAPQAFPAQFAPPEPAAAAAPPVAPPPAAPPAAAPPAVAPAEPVSVTPAAPVQNSPLAEQPSSSIAAASLSATGSQEPVPGLSPVQRARIDRRLKKKRNYQLMLVGLCVVAVILVVALVLVITMSGGESPS